MAKAEKAFVTEAAMCKRFLSALPEEWVSYLETAGWDILLVRKADGFQVGIQAKLKLNAHVISQALENYGVWSVDRPGPDCRAILVPWDQSGYELICKYIGITVIRVTPEQTPSAWGYVSRTVFEPALPGGYFGNQDPWQEWAPMMRHMLPDYVPDVTAGSPAPIQLTSWKIAALKLTVLLDRRGHVLRSDFKHLGIDHRRWLPSGAGWLVIDGGRYIKGAHFPDFARQHPRVYREIEADFETWKPREADPEMKQEPLL